MITKHTVIYKLYPSAVSILEESTDDFKVVDKDGKSVTIDLVVSKKIKKKAQ